MKIEKVSITSITNNEKNPRGVTKSKLDSLVKSIQEFPKMMEIRPIVVDHENIIIGGNMRYEAAKKIGLKEVFIVRANFNEHQRKEFIIKDNLNYGDWDLNALHEIFDSKDLLSWGGGVFPDWEDETKEKQEPVHDKDMNTYENNPIKQVVFYFNNKDHVKVLDFFKRVKLEKKFKHNSQVISMLTENYERIRN